MDALKTFLVSARRIGRVLAYTDGACELNKGDGGWACVFLAGEARHEIGGHVTGTTCNRMEVQAAIAALETIPPAIPLLILTDSEYLRLGVTEWMPRWKSKGWRRGPRIRSWRETPYRDVKNLDQWQALDALIAGREVRWERVAGHSGHSHNDRADKLAVRFRREGIGASVQLPEQLNRLDCDPALLR